MHQAGGRDADQVLRRHVEDRLRRGAREAHSPVGGMPRDQVHRVVGEESVHRGAFGRGLVGGALAVLRGGGDERRLDHRGKHRHRVEFPQRHRQARHRQRAERPDGGDDDERDGGGGGGPQHGGTPARQGRFRRHQGEPHDQRRQHPAGQRREIADQDREDGERRLFQQRERNRREGEERQDRRRHQAGDGDGFGDIGAADERHEGQAQHRADHRLRRLHRDEEATQRAAVARIACDFVVNRH
ncbi:MAG: hypothetical protein WDM81_01155 [Rhizomicrobium sp.]